MSADAPETGSVPAPSDDRDAPGFGVQERLFETPPDDADRRQVPASGEAPSALGSPAMQTTAEQEQAIARRAEPLLLAAGAGSGKTTVLVERFIRAVLEDGIPPAAILAITFTERAAGELRERVRERLIALGHRAAARETEAAFVGTFHGFCARLLRAHPLLAPLAPDFSIIDEGLAGALADRAFVEAVGEFQELRGGEAVDLLAAYGVDQVRQMIAGVHAELRSRGESEPSLPAPVPRADAADPEAEEEAVRACRLFDALLTLFGRAYTRMKRERASADFDDLELGALALLRGSEAVRSSTSERFRLLMVDEFQDTNPRQLAILEALDRDNLFTVGDEMQSIYGFRHARVELFRERRAALAPHGRSLDLTANFRSAPELLEVVNRAFAGRVRDGGFTALVAGRAVQPAGAAAHDAAGAPAVELLLTDRFGWDDETLAASLGEGLPRASGWRLAEARLLAARVRELVDSGCVRAGDVVVLLRATGDIDIYERALELTGLRTLAFVGGFWRRLEIRDLLARLRTLANPLDEKALYETLAAPPLSLSTDGMAILAAAARRRGRSVWDVARDGGEEEPLDRSERSRLAAFCTGLSADRRDALAVGIAGLIERALAAGYRERLVAQPDAARRLANVQKLLRLARRFEESDGNDLRSFLDHAQRLADDGSREPDAPVESVDPDAVRLMSIHAAKGLEFPVVCVADLSRGPNTRVPRLLVDGSRIGLQLVRLDGAKARACLDYQELSDERSSAQAEEEDRILYVAMTRARDLLLLSGAVDVERWPDPSDRTAIGWISTVLGEELDALPRHSGSWDLELAGGEGTPRVRYAVSRPDGADMLLPGEPDFWAAGPQDTGTVAAASPPSTGSRLSRAAGGGALHGLSSISYTALARLERCGYRFYLERVLGLPETPTRGERTAARELAAETRGTVAHRLMEQIDFARPRTPNGEDVEMAARREGARATPAEGREIVALIAGALAAPLAQRIAAAAQARREHPFAFTIGDEKPLVTGVIDLLASEADGTALVVDYKTDRLAGGEDVARRADADYALQRLIYAVAVLRGGAAATEVVHWFLHRPCEPATARFEGAELPRLEAELATRLRAADARGFVVTERPHRALCLTCPGRAGLCSWSEREQLRESPDGI